MTAGSNWVVLLQSEKQEVTIDPPGDDRNPVHGKAQGLKPTAEDVVKAFKGLAIAAARARELATSHGKEDLLGDLPRRQKDAVRQHLLEIKADVETGAPDHDQGLNGASTIAAHEFRDGDRHAEVRLAALPVDAESPRRFDPIRHADPITPPPPPQACCAADSRRREDSDADDAAMRPS